MNGLHPAVACAPACHPSRRRRDLCTLTLAGLAWPAAQAGAAEAKTAAVADRWYTTSDGVRLHYLEAGAAQPGRPVFVLIPGWSMPAWIWSAQIEHLAAENRVIAFDPRGQGRSAVPASGYDYRRRAADIAELLQAADIGQAVLVGWSLGVLECLQALSSASRPDLRGRVQGLVLVDNSVGEGPAPPPATASRGGPTFFSRLRSRRRETVDAFVRAMFKRPQPAAWLAELTEAALSLPVQASIALLSQPTPREFWRDTLYALQMPVLYVVTPRLAHQGELAQAHRAAIETVVFEDAGHALFVDDAARFDNLLDQFILRLPAAGPVPR